MWYQLKIYFTIVSIIIPRNKVKKIGSFHMHGLDTFRDVNIISGDCSTITCQCSLS